MSWNGFTRPARGRSDDLSGDRRRARNAAAPAAVTAPVSAPVATASPWPQRTVQTAAAGCSEGTAERCSSIAGGPCGSFPKGGSRRPHRIRSVPRISVVSPLAAHGPTAQPEELRRRLHSSCTAWCSTALRAASAGIERTAVSVPGEPIRGGGWRLSYSWAPSLYAPALTPTSLGEPGGRRSPRRTSAHGYHERTKVETEHSLRDFVRSR